MDLAQDYVSLLGWHGGIMRSMLHITDLAVQRAFAILMSPLPPNHILVSLPGG